MLGTWFDPWMGNSYSACRGTAKPLNLKTVLCNKRSDRNEKPARDNKAASAPHNSRKPVCSNEGPTETNKYRVFKNLLDLSTGLVRENGTGLRNVTITLTGGIPYCPRHCPLPCEETDASTPSLGGRQLYSGGTAACREHALSFATLHPGEVSQGLPHSGRP